MKRREKEERGWRSGTVIPPCVVRVDRDPEVHIARVAIVTVVADGVATHQQVVNAVGIQQPQKIAKVRG